MPLDVLALRLLAYLAELQAPGDENAVTRSLVSSSSAWSRDGPVERSRQKAMIEAWDWLVANGLLTGPSRQNRDEAFVTRRGVDLLADPAGLARLRAERRLDVDLHERIADRVRTQYLIGQYEAAAFLALRQVEIRVRELAGMPEGRIGPAVLMQKAFAHEEGRLGPLADHSMEPSERAGQMALFWGAMGLYKNPSSHREVDHGDPTLASEVVLLADLLLRILDGVEARIASK
jgi:uncharacterized protein (TIGR02391 family)